LLLRTQQRAPIGEPKTGGEHPRKDQLQQQGS
jgi:hypothetical protein